MMDRYLYVSICLSVIYRSIDIHKIHFTNICFFFFFAKVFSQTSNSCSMGPAEGLLVTFVRRARVRTQIYGAWVAPAHASTLCASTDLVELCPQEGRVRSCDLLLGMFAMVARVTTHGDARVSSSQTKSRSQFVRIMEELTATVFSTLTPSLGALTR